MDHLEDKDEEVWQWYQDNVDKLLTATITVDCNFVENTLGPKLIDLTSAPTDEIVHIEESNIRWTTSDVIFGVSQNTD